MARRTSCSLGGSSPIGGGEPARTRGIPRGGGASVGEGQEGGGGDFLLTPPPPKKRGGGGKKGRHHKTGGRPGRSSSPAAPRPAAARPDPTRAARDMPGRGRACPPVKRLYT